MICIGRGLASHRDANFACCSALRQGDESGQVRQLVASAQVDIPGHAWLAPQRWNRLCDALHLLGKRVSALECILEGGRLGFLSCLNQLMLRVTMCRNVALLHF